MWKSCHLSNLAYRTVLRYKTALQIDPAAQSFVVEKQHSKLVWFYFSLFVIFVVQVAMLDVVVEVWVFQSFHAPLYMVIINLASFGLTVGCLSLICVALQNRDTLWGQYYNNVIQLEKKLFMMTQPKKLQDLQESSNYFDLLLKGKLSILKL